MAETVKIRVPKTVVLKDNRARDLRGMIEGLSKGLVKVGKLSQAQADATVAALLDSVPKAERNYPIEEFVGVVLDSAPVFKGGRSKAMKMARRIQDAFEDKGENDIVELSVDAQTALKTYLDEPEYKMTDPKTGEEKTVKDPPTDAYAWRQAVPYMEAICEPLKEEEKKKDEPAVEKPAEPAKEVASG